MILPDGGSRRVVYVGSDPESVRSALATAGSRPYSLETVNAVGDVTARSLDGTTVGLIADHDGPDSAALALLDGQAGDVDVPSATPLVALVDDGADPRSVLAAGAVEYVDARVLTDRPDILDQRIRTAVTDRSGAWYETLLEHSTDFLSVVDPDGTVRYQSPSVRSVLGYDPDEEEGNPAFRRVHEDDSERVESAFTSLLSEETDAVESIECRVPDDDGEWQWIESVARNRLDSVLGGFVVSTRRVTERKERERRLEQAETVFQHVTDGVFLVDVTDERRFEVRRVNDAYEELTGLDGAEMRGKTPSEIVGPEIGRQIEGKLAECADRQTPLSYEETFDVPDLPTYWHTRLAPVVVDGEVDGIVGTTRDITERKEREAELELKTRAMDEAPIGITIADERRPGSPIIYVNDGFEAVTGYDATEVRERTWSLLHGPETDDATVREMEADLESGEPAAAELLLYRADGTPFWSRVSLAPVTGSDDDEVSHVVGFQQDVTERKEYEKEIERRFDEFGEVLAEELRQPIVTAREHLAATGVGGDDDLTAVADALARLQTLLDQLSTVHSHAVTSRSTAEEALAGTRDEDD